MQSLYDYYNNKSEIPLDWDYLNSQLGVGQPPGTPICPYRSAKRVFSWTWRRRVSISRYPPHTGRPPSSFTTVPSSNPATRRRPPASATWRIYVGYSCARQIGLGDIPIAGSALDPATFSINTVQVLINTAALTATECTALYTYLNGGVPPTASLNATNYLMAAAPQLDGMKSPSVRARVGVTIMGAPELLEVAYEPDDPSLLPNCDVKPPRIGIGPVRLSRISLEADFARPRVSRWSCKSPCRSPSNVPRWSSSCKAPG